MTIFRLVRSAGLTLMVLGVGACASSLSPVVQAKDQGAPVKVQAGPGFTPQVLYRLLAAEIAGQRGEFGLAVRYYKDVAYDTRDPRVIERALRLAAFVQAKGDMSELARLWSTVAPQASEPHLALAMLLLERGDVAGAVEQFEQVYKVDPKLGYMPIVSNLARFSDKALAMDAMARFMKSRQKDPDALFAHAHFAARIGEVALAESSVERALQLRPNWGAALILQAHVLAQQGKSDVALNALQKALSGPLADDFDVRMAYARMLVDAQRFGEASAQFAELAKKNPDHPDVLYALGVTAAQQEKYAEAENYFKRLVALGQREAEASYQLGQMMELQKRDDEALVWYGAVKEGGLMVPAQMRIVAVLTNQRKFDQALSQIESIDVDNLNDRLSVALLHGEVMFRAKRYTEAMAIYDEALTNFPDDTRLLYAHSLVAEKMGRLDVAEKDLRAILAREPNNAMALNALGYTLADRTTRFAEAEELIKAALAQKPDDPAILDSMGWLYFRKGDAKSSVEYLRKALGKLNDPEIAAHLGEVLWQTGDQQGAVKVWRDALKLEPMHEVLLETMKRHGQ